MLTEITIKNFAIIAELSLDFNEGMTVFTGSTGAGKSIFFDALSFCLGARVEAKAVRQGEEQAEVSAIFELPSHHPARYWLSDKSLGNSKNCIVRRILRKSGRTKCYINDHPITCQNLQAFGALIIDFHGQHEHYSLMKEETQRRLLDGFANNEEALTQVYQLYREYQELNQQILHLTEHHVEYRARLDLLTYQIAELEELAPEENEFAKLSTLHTQLAKADVLQSTIEESCHRLFSDDAPSASQLNSQVLDTLRKLKSSDSRLVDVIEALSTVNVYYQEIEADLYRLAHDSDVDPERLNDIELRLSRYQEIARKHRVEPEQLFSHLKLLQDEHASLSQKITDPELAEQQLQLIKEQYQTLCKEITVRRTQAALELGKKITAQLKQLDMGESLFSVAINSDESLVAPYGQDRIAFQVAANTKGEPLPIAKFASGGELSRISLAIQVIVADKQNPQTLIFDEVDVGIGGRTSEIVGKLLKKLAKSTQVLCVTHQGQVAAQATHHILVSKKKSQNALYSQVGYLDKDKRIAELARMIGGVELTDNTKMHAQELLLKAIA